MISKLYSEYKDLGEARVYKPKKKAMFAPKPKPMTQRKVEYRDDNGTRDVGWWSDDMLGSAKKVNRFSINKAQMIQMRRKTNRGEQLAGAALLAAGTSRMKGIGRILEVGAKSQRPLIADASKLTRKVHRYAGDAYDYGAKQASQTKVGADIVAKPYTPGITAAIGAGMVAHGRKRETIQGW